MTGRRSSGIKARLGPSKHEKRANRRTPSGHEVVGLRATDPRPAALVRTTDERVEKDFVAQVNVILCQKFIKAQINSGIQSTLIGTEVAELVTRRTGKRSLSRFMGRGVNRSLENVITVRLGTRLSRMRDIECVIDPNIPPKSVVLGMRALKSLGYQLVIGGRRAYQATVTN